MLSAANFRDLKEKGYTVVSDVLSDEECERTIGQYRDWLSQFQDGEWPFSSNSLLQRYNTGNMEASWFVRLKCKKVFAQIWGTDKLLSSIDAIAIGRPPESGDEHFHIPGEHWLHLDQSPERVGLHAYQGGVSLEHIDEDDWTLQVLENSHTLYQGFYDSHPRESLRADINGYCNLKDEHVKWYTQKGCASKRVPVPKGGMVLWDSRLAHANARPLKRRKNPGRWRFCVFVSMTPAIWATPEDLAKKKEAYDNALMTTHWSSQGVSFFRTTIPSFARQDVKYPKSLPDIAKTDEAKLLCGVKVYNFNDGQPTGEEFRPKWKRSEMSNHGQIIQNKTALVIKLLGVGVAIGAIGYAVYRIENR